MDRKHPPAERETTNEKKAPRAGSTPSGRASDSDAHAEATIKEFDEEGMGIAPKE